MKCKPTWSLSTSPKVRVSDASYVYLEDILFSNKIFEDSYAERCIKEQILVEKSVARIRMRCAEKRSTRYHKSCENPWLAGKKRVRTDSFELDFARDKVLQEVYDILDLTDCNNFAPHFGQEWVSSVDTILASLSSYAGEKITDEVISHVEGLIALLVALQGTTDFMSAGAVLLLYFRKFSDRSLTSQVLEYLNEFFSPQSGFESDEINDSTYWIDMMKNLHTNWALVRDNKLFSHLSKLLGVVVTMEMCKASDVTFSIKEMKIFEPDLKVIHGNAVDVIDAALCSVAFFVEVFSMCHEKKSLKPLIINDTAALELDEEYALICSYWDLVQNGNLMKVRGVSENEFDRRLEKLTTQIRSLLPNLKGFDKKVVQDKFMRLLNMKNDYVTMKISSGVRKSPFAIELFGPSSQGKTMISEQILSALLTSAGLPTGKEYQASLNAGDKFMSTWTTDKVVMTVDDLANEKSDFVERPPTRAIIDICNNQAFYANMADLSSKGKVFVEPEIMMVTTNIKDLDARAYSNCPYSVQRRMHVVITVNAKREFQHLDSEGRPIGVDSELVDAAYEGMSEPPLFDDIWTLTVERAVMPEKLTSRAPYEVMKYNGVELKDVDFETVLNFMIDKFQRHKQTQDSIIERMKLRQRKLELCGIDGCRQIRDYCKKHKHCCDPVICLRDLEQCSFSDADSVEEFYDSSQNENSDGDTVNSENYSVGVGEISNDEIEAYLATIHEREIADGDPLADYSDFGNLSQLHDDNDDPLEDYDPHWGEEIVSSIEKSGQTIYGRISSDLFGIGTATESLTAYMILRAGRKFSRHWDWMALVPTPWLNNDKFFQFCMVASQNRLKFRYVRYTAFLWAMIGMMFYTFQNAMPSLSVSILLSLIAFGCCVQKTMIRVVEHQFRKELRKRNVISPVFQDLRNRHIGNVCKAGGIIAVLYGISRVYKAWRKKCNTLEAHGSLHPTTREEVEKRDAEASPWTPVVERPLPVQNVARNTTSTQLRDMLLTNLRYASIKTSEGRMAANCLFLKSNLLLLPQHYFVDDELDVDFIYTDPDANGGKFSAILSKSAAHFVPGTDIAMCYVPNGGSFRDLSGYLPDGLLSKCEFTMIHRDKLGNVSFSNGLAKFGETGHSKARFYGFEYHNYTGTTFAGMCGATAIAEHKPIILGVHLGGKAQTNEGCAGTLTLDQYKRGLTFLKGLEGVVFSGTADNFEKNVMGVPIMTNKTLHKKSPVRFMPHGSQIVWHGTCIGHSTFKSSAKPTLISEHVMDVMDAPNIYCKPIESPQWEPWQKCLANMSVPGQMFSPELLYWAITDYKSDLIPIFKHEMWNDTRPLTDIENWNGVPGKKFIDRIKTNTSVGFPLTGRKEKYLVEVEPLGEYTKVVEPEAVVQEEIDRLLQCYRDGKRAYPIAKACKKDEILDKRKCRIFYSNPVALTFLVRKYFLPILRVLQFYPKVSECAVGINSHGPEWNELHEHIYTFGEDRLIGGDYGKYDQKLPSQLLLAALRILIDFARCCDYSEEDLSIMESMTGDLVYAVIAFNGDLISLNSGSHISGNSLTVILNGICGSLNLRCYFYSEHMPRDGGCLSFRDCVKLITYGDDNIGSVRPDISDFTIKGASEFLEAHGQVYTMPDKESELVDFLPPEEFEFLKRVSVFHPKLGVHVGALVDQSCFKSLHYYLRDRDSVDSERVACAKNIDTACREWFNHGEQVYDIRRRQLIEVAERAGLRHLCEELDVSYDTRVEMWRDKYL
jgi:hypothetical protein